MSELYTDYNMHDCEKYIEGHIIKSFSLKVSRYIMKRAMNNQERIFLLILSGISFCYFKYTYDSNIKIGIAYPSVSVQLRKLEFEVNSHLTYNDYLKDLSMHFDNIKTGQCDCIDAIDADFVVCFGDECIEDNIQNKIQYRYGIGENDEIFLELLFNLALFNERILEMFAHGIVDFISRIIYETSTILFNVSVISNIDKETIKRWNNTSRNLPIESSFVKLLKQQIALRGDEIAVIHNGMHITYYELNKRSDDLAGYLQSIGVCSNSIVGVMMDRSIDVIVALCAIYKVGGIYLPIDVNNPTERTRAIIDDSLPSVVVLDRKHIEDCSYDSIVVYEEVDYCSSEYRVWDKNYDSPAYIIYTSGTTGSPKGVMVNHNGMLNHIFAKINDLQITHDSIVAQNSSIGFDISIWQILAPLIVGGKIVIYDDSVIHDIKKFVELLCVDGVTILEAVPTFLTIMISYLEGKKENFHLRYLISTGEELNGEILRKLKSTFPGVSIVNAYGPTEAADDVTHCVLNEYDCIRVPIGNPIQNMKIHILDMDSHMCPIGAVGEICISGVGVSGGYLNNARYNESKYIASHCIENIKDRIYKTGDLGRWNYNGQVEYVGRIDSQVKIRGYRIELSEIESCLITNNDIDNAVVVIMDQGANSYIKAFVSSKKLIDSDLMTKYLEERLPFYMIPSCIVQVNEFPLNTNGKIDKKALSKMQLNKANMSEESNGSFGNIKQIMIEAWQSVFKLEHISMDDDFFDLGGDSIKAIQIAARLLKNDVHLEVYDFFNYPILSQLCNHVEPLIHLDTEYDGFSQLSPAQMWFFEENLHEYPYYNQSVLLHCKQTVSYDTIKIIFEEIVKVHSALRSKVKMNPATLRFEQYFERYKPDSFTLEQFDLTGVDDYEFEITKRANDIQRKIDYNRGPIMKLGLFNTKHGDFLLIIIHHLFVDGVSWRIILNDFVESYKLINSNEKINIPKEIGHFSQWTESLNEYSKNLKEESISWWMRLFDDHEKSECVPSSFHEEFVTVFETLDSSETAELLNSAKRYYETDIATLLVTTVGLTLREFNIGDGIIYYEWHGRNALGNELQIDNTVGWFTSIFPIIVDVDKGNICKSVDNVKRELNSVPNRGMDYGVMKYLTSRRFCEYGDGRDEKIIFNYLGEFGEQLNENEFSFSNISQGDPIHPKSRRPFSIEIIIKIVNSALEISINFSSKFYNERLMHSFIKEYKKKTIDLLKENGHKSFTIGRHYISYDAIEQTKYDNLMKTVMNRYGNNALIGNIYPLLPSMERVLFYSLYYKNKTLYHEQLTLDIFGRYDHTIFCKSLQMIVDHFEVFHSIFLYHHFSVPVQVVINNSYKKIDVNYIDASRKNINIIDIEKREFEALFEFDNGNLYRITIVRIKADAVKLIFSYHHILFDGWSLDIILNKLFTIYNALAENKMVSIESTGTNQGYYDHYLKNRNIDNYFFWQNHFKDYKTNKRRKVSCNTAYSSKQLCRLVNDIDEIRDFCKRNRITVNTFVQAVFSLAYQELIESDDIIFNFVISGRSANIVDIDNMVGFFSNALPIRYKFMPDECIIDYMHRAQREITRIEKSAYESAMTILKNNNIPLSDIDAVVAFENYPRSFGNYDISVKNIKFKETNHYSLSCIVTFEDKLEIKLIYNESIYSFTRMDRLIKHMELITKNIIDMPEIKVSSVKNRR